MNLSVVVTVFPNICVMYFLQLQYATWSVPSVLLLARTDYGATDPTRLPFPCESSLLSLTQCPFRYIRKVSCLVYYFVTMLFQTHRTSMYFYGCHSYPSLSLCEQNDIYEWSRDHRVHHKYSETDADPHNATRGFFFSHIGWLLVRKHPDVIEKGQKLELSDLKADNVVMFQRRWANVTHRCALNSCSRHRLFRDIQY